MNSVVMGQYLPGNSFLHQLDSRTKLIFVFGSMILIFLANNPVTYTFLVSIALIGILFSQIPFILFLKSIRAVVWIVLFTVLLHLFLTKGGSIVVELPFLTIYEEGIRQAIFTSIRFILLVVFASLLTFTTSPIDLTDGLETLLSPLKRVHFPAHEFAMMMSIALRFIPTLWGETEKIIKAQKARGADFESGNLIRRGKAYIPVLIPLLISAFRRAEDLAMAMEARCYRGGEGRTKLRELRMTKQDLIVLLTLLSIAVLLVLFRK